VRLGPHAYSAPTQPRVELLQPHAYAQRPASR